MDTPLDEQRAEELLDVWGNRYREARHAGLDHDDAIRFARGHQDIGELRKLVRDGCPLRLLREIVL